jgi:hypothetical protein
MVAFVIGSWLRDEVGKGLDVLWRFAEIRGIS